MAWSPQPTHVMPRQHARTPRDVVRRGAGWGSLAGLITGFVAGTLLVPVIGSVIGLVTGGVVGLVLGTIIASVLAAFTDVLTTRGRASAANATLAGLVGSPLPGLVDVDVRITIGFALTCALIGGLLGPRVVLGPSAW